MPVPEGAKVMFVAPADGATIQGPVKVKMGIEGMTVKPAGTMEANTGHHHIVVDGKSVEKGTVVPADDTHIHYGKGQTETELKLAPGKHTITLQFADGAHRSYGAQLSTTITVTVTE
ncbi:MAG TPA: rod shape-determining protein RodA [Deltaproteobacteria bacterium]|nr:rod shape-determining protein RodA [Deltaproteobacteria bacterium]